MANKNYLTPQIQEIEALKGIYDDFLVMDPIEEQLKDIHRDVDLRLKIIIPFELADPNDCITINTDDRCHAVPTCHAKIRNGNVFKIGAFKRSVCIAHPIISLQITFGKYYPFNSPPKIRLGCTWLEREKVDKIISKLNKLFKKAPVVYDYVTFIQETVVSNFDSKSEVTWNDEPHAMYDQLIFDEKIERKEFASKVQMCPVCMLDISGSEFIFIETCLHKFCKNCLRKICSMNTKNGTLNRIICPEPGCEEPFPVDMLRSLLSDKLWKRWSKLSVTRNNNAKTGIVICPKCNGPLSLGLNKVATCFKCEFEFCRMCQQKWHPNKICKVEVEDMVSNLKSLIFISVHTKTCPTCRSPIMKTGGCYSVKCSVCNGLMCWICGKDTSFDEWHGDYPECIGKNINYVYNSKLDKKITTLAEKGDVPVAYCLCGHMNFQINPRKNYAKCFSCQNIIYFCCINYSEATKVSDHYNSKNGICLKKMNRHTAVKKTKATS